MPRALAVNVHSFDIQGTALIPKSEKISGILAIFGQAVRRPREHERACIMSGLRNRSGSLVMWRPKCLYVEEREL
jgi:hypothetical protein